MDPSNNPTPTPNPEPVTPPTPEPAAPVEPVEPAAPAPEAPAGPVPPVAPNPEPVNPIINPGANPTPVNPVFQPSGQGGLAATDPIMQPERPPEPDPIEEELKAPMQPAGPVPGSIGSAVSGPSEASAAEAPAGNPFTTEPQTQSVSFTDPATQPEAPNGAPAVKPAKGKSNKTTLIVLIAVAAVIVVVLAVILIMQLTSNNSSSQPVVQDNGTSTVVPDEESEDEDEGEVVSGNGTLSCTRNMTQEELVSVNDAISGTISISAEFDNDEMTIISRVDSVVYSDEHATETEPVENEVQETKAADLTAANGLNYFLSADADGALDLTFDAVQANYENLDFVCEVL